MTTFRAIFACALVAVASCAAQAPVAEHAPTTKTCVAPPPEVAEPITELPRHRTTGLRRPATATEGATIEVLAGLCEAVRALKFTRPVRIEVEDELAITQSLMKEIEDDDIEHATVVYTALGLLERDIDLRKVFEELLAEQVVGYYNPTGARLVIRNDVMSSLSLTRRDEKADENRLTIIHELVHALQDQHLGLGPANEKERTSDADNAFRAVVEGDATLAMIAHLLMREGLPMEAAAASIQQMGELIDLSALVSGDKLQQAPAILRLTLLAPYLEGLQFIAAVFNRGGWSAVDKAHRAPPTTTEQVLHPHKFFAGEPGEHVRIPTLPALKRAGWTKLGEDTLGELELGVYFGQLMASGVDKEAAQGWGGDQVRVYRKDTQSAVVWFTTWDSDRDAIEAEEAARRVSAGRSTDRVLRSGRALLMIRSLPAELHEAVVRAFKAFELKRHKAPKSS